MEARWPACHRRARHTPVPWPASPSPRRRPTSASPPRSSESRASVTTSRGLRVLPLPSARLAQETLGRLLVALGAEHELDGLPSPADGAVELAPRAVHADVRFIDVPR